jgi:hypothetical protein
MNAIPDKIEDYPAETEIFRSFCLLCPLKSLSNTKKPSEMIKRSPSDFYDCQFPAKKSIFH